MGADFQTQSNLFLPLGKVRMGCPFGRVRMGCPFGRVRMGLRQVNMLSAAEQLLDHFRVVFVF